MIYCSIFSFLLVLPSKPATCKCTLQTSVHGEPQWGILLHWNSSPAQWLSFSLPSCYSRKETANNNIKAQWSKRNHWLNGNPLVQFCQCLLFILLCSFCFFYCLLVKTIDCLVKTIDYLVKTSIVLSWFTFNSFSLNPFIL